MSTYNLAMFSVAKTVPVGRMKHYGAPKADFIIQKPYFQVKNCLLLSETIYYVLEKLPLAFLNNALCSLKTVAFILKQFFICKDLP